MQRKAGVKYFVHSYTYAEFKILQLYNFEKSDQNATKLCTRLFVHIILQRFDL